MNKADILNNIEFHEQELSKYRLELEAERLKEIKDDLGYIYCEFNGKNPILRINRNFYPKDIPKLIEILEALK